MTSACLRGTVINFGFLLLIFIVTEFIMAEPSTRKSTHLRKHKIEDAYH